MRRYQKKLIMELFSTIEEVHDEIFKELDKQNFDIVTNLLADCQDGAIHIGRLIEESEGEGIPIIAKLVNYCEDLYRITISIHEIDSRQVYSLLKESMIHIKNEFYNNIKSRKEVVFLPYKASMWDSMESIWSAARKDENCDVYVIPIPYFEKEAASNKASICYEGRLFPEYVPIEAYDKYDFETMHPDVIYIHNPYDKNNFVTSVHPNYYSSELKKYTDMLVYVPYYVTGGSVTDSLRNLPAYYNADKIIVQSKKIIRHYDSLFKKKIVPLGSPKIDNIFNYNKKSKHIPKEWEDIIKNKKVIMYNTSISSLLKFGSSFVKKMEQVFSIFKNRDDVVLLWRPHPLIKATLKAMNPQLLHRYCDVERYFINECIGILDFTPDVTASVILSDAYIGEETSSIVHLFGVSGKPIFLLDIDVHNIETLEEKTSVCFCDYEVDGEYIWYVHAYYNALCKLNTNNGQSELVKRIPEESFEMLRSYNDILKVGDNLILSPMSASNIYEYNISNNSIKKIELKKPRISNFIRSVRYKDDVFMVPTVYPSVLKYNVKAKKYDDNSKCINNLRKFANDKKNFLFMYGVCVRDNLLLMASVQDNLILELNMDTGDDKIYRVGKKGNRYWGMEYDGENYWLNPFQGNTITKWNYETGEYVEYNNYPEGFIGETECFINIICCGTYMLAFPKMANMIIKIDIETGEMSEYKLNLQYKEGERKSEFYRWNSNYYFAKKKDDNTILAMSAYDNNLIEIDLQTTCHKVINCKIDNWSELRQYLFEDGFGYQGENLPYACREKKFIYSVDGFVDYVLSGNHKALVQKQEYEKVIDNMDGSSGEKIHKYIMDQF